MLGWIQNLALGGSPVAITVPDAEGLEFTLPTSKVHFTMDQSRTHFTLDVSRHHYTMDDDE